MNKSGRSIQDILLIEQKIPGQELWSKAAKQLQNDDYCSECFAFHHLDDNYVWTWDV